MAQDSGEVEAAKEIGRLAGAGENRGITLQRSERGWLVEKRLRAPVGETDFATTPVKSIASHVRRGEQLPRLSALLVVGSQTEVC